MKFVLLVLIALFSSDMALASGTTNTECTGRSFAFDFQDSFTSEKAGFDWCFKRIVWWGLNTGDGWRGRFCSSNRYSIGYNQWRWSNRFRHQFHQYQGRGGFDVFNNFSRFYSQRIFRGFPGRIEFSFDSDCRGGYGDEY